MPRGVHRRQGSNVNARRGFCVSCGATKSSRFCPASEKWKIFYKELLNLKENWKKSNPKICNACHVGFYTLPSNGSELHVEDQGTKNDTPTKPLVKKSPIGGNGKSNLLIFFSEYNVFDYLLLLKRFVC
jgi:hypothetical protein